MNTQCPVNRIKSIIKFIRESYIQIKITGIVRKLRFGFPDFPKISRQNRFILRIIGFLRFIFTTSNHTTDQQSNRYNFEILFHSIRN